ncbi:hypothetical protein WJX84_001010 [Apatococcus fuscideae]|uniref:Expansin-like EG45 domain-containing protein n=1 Tax=Apatococcus fuscideae TaxID=2026836 RepID=A0AAW1SMW8_9CHLO
MTNQRMQMVGHRGLAKPGGGPARTLDNWSDSTQPKGVALAETASSLPTDWRNGIATNYGGPHDGDSPYSPSYGTDIGACGYGLLDKGQWPYWSVGALSSSNMFYSAGPINGCGQCFEIQCVNSGGEYAGRCNGDGGESVTIMVSDACPECEADHLDLQALTYNQLGPMALGRIDIKYRRVNCKPPVNMMVDVDSSSGEGGWIRMTVKNAAGRAAIKGVALRGSGSSSWTDLTNDWGARFETGNQPYGAPFDLQVTQDDGQVVSLTSRPVFLPGWACVPKCLGIIFPAGLKRCTRIPARTEQK